MQEHNLLFFINFYVLVNQDRIAIGIDDHKACRPGRAFIRFTRECHALILEFPLQVADVREIVKLLALGVPAWIEGERILFKHALKQADYTISVSEDLPSLFVVTTDGFES